MNIITPISTGSTKIAPTMNYKLRKLLAKIEASTKQAYKTNNDINEARVGLSLTLAALGK